MIYKLAICHETTGTIATYYIIQPIGVREGGAGGGGGAAAPPKFLRIYLFGQKLSCHSGNDGLVIRRIY